ncbi:TPA: hypothetical protein ACOSST_005205 [Escherichia coli]
MMQLWNIPLIHHSDDVFWLSDGKISFLAKCDINVNTGNEGVMHKTNDKGQVVLIENIIFIAGMFYYVFGLKIQVPW